MRLRLQGLKTITQATSKATAVNLDAPCGQITMNAASLAAATSVGFTLTDNYIGVNDFVDVQLSSGGTLASYQVSVDSVAAGQCTIHLRNVSAGALAEAIVITFIVMKLF